MQAVQATVNLATETALVRAALSQDSDGHAQRLEVLGKELTQVCIVSHQQGMPVHVVRLV